MFKRLSIVLLLAGASISNASFLGQIARMATANSRARIAQTGLALGFATLATKSVNAQELPENVVVEEEAASFSPAVNTSYYSKTEVAQEATPAVTQETTPVVTTPVVTQEAAIVQEPTRFERFKSFLSSTKDQGLKGLAQVREMGPRRAFNTVHRAYHYSQPATRFREAVQDGSVKAAEGFQATKEFASVKSGQALDLASRGKQAAAIKASSTMEWLKSTRLGRWFSGQ